ncbi:MAG: FtsW/RodA/SpoVE family cell cycle protein [bacterium]
MIKSVRRILPRLEDYDGWLLLSVLVLCSLGTVMVLSAGSFRFQGPPGQINHYYYLGKHLARLALGIIGMLVLANLDYRFLRKPLFNWGLIAAGLAFIGLPLILNDGDFRRWTNIGLFPIQPLELTKLAVVLFLAGRLVSLDRKQTDYRRQLGITLLIPMLAVAILILQPNYGNALVISLLTLALLFITGISNRLLVAALVPVTVAVGLGYLFEPKISNRVQAWWSGLEGEGLCYQVEQSLIGIGAGGLLGSGVGASHQRFWFLPESHTDFIFAVLGEELGLLGTLGALAMFALFAYRGYTIARRARDPFGQVVATGLTTLIFLYVITNLAMVVGLFPVIGVPLPFVSYGGSALVTNLAAVGILLSIDRQGRAHQVWRARLARV